MKTFFPDMENRNFDHIGYRTAIKNQMAFALASVCQNYHLEVEFDYISRDYCVMRNDVTISSGHLSMVSAYQWIIKNAAYMLTEEWKP